MEALRIANRVRIAAAEVRSEILAGTLSVAEALCDERAQAMAVFDLLKAQYRWGEARARGIVRAFHMTEWLKVRDLTDRQRHMLEGALLWAKAPERKAGWE